MGRKPRTAIGWIAALLLLTGCSEGRNYANMETPRVALHFEQIEIPGVTTDRQSTGGVSWVDYDNDGHLDLFVTNGYDVSAEAPVGQPNQLYRNDGAGGFVAMMGGVLVEGAAISSGHTWGDYDNDGDLDVFVANQLDQNNALFRNDGDGKFVAVEDVPQVSDGGHSYAAAWIDVDNDGLLDLFVANGGMSHAGPNGLYRNRGDGHFEKITEGTVVTDVAATCGIAWGDYDNDGDADLFVANSGFAPPGNNNALYRNDGEWRFTRIEDTTLTRDGVPSCAATWVDIDNDLDLDLHVTNMYGLADFLYTNDGSGSLTRIEGSPVTLDGGHSYGANFEDYDNNGAIDLIVANWGAGPAVYLNDGTGSFERRGPGDLGGTVLFVGAMASGDFDADGRVDVYVGNWPNEPGPGELNPLYRNRGSGAHWLRVRLTGTTSNRSGVGARVVATTRSGGAETTQMRQITTQMGFRGQSELTAHFGLGPATEVASLEVRWPSGQVSTLGSVAADQTIEITEP